MDAAPPPADDRPTLAAPDDDPHLWLEDIDSPAALAWVDAQSAASLRRFAGPGFAPECAALQASLDRDDRIAFVTRRAGLLYNFWKDAAQPRGVWRRTTEASYRGGAPDWDVLLDLDALARAEGEDWVWQGAATLPGTHDLALLRLSRGGGDAVALREFDLSAHRLVTGGFALAEAKSSAAWLDRDTLLLASALGGATRSGYASTVRLWRRGADPMTAPVLFEAAGSSMAASVQVDRTGGTERVVFSERTGFFDAATHLGDRSGPQRQLDLPSDARFDWHADWLAVSPRMPWEVGGTTYPPDSVLGIGLDAFLAGERGLAVLFTPGNRQALEGFFWCAGRLVLSVLDQLQPRFPVFTPSATGWAEGALGGLPGIGVVSVWPFDTCAEESDGWLLASTEDPLRPPALLALDPGLDPGSKAGRDPGPAAPALLRQGPALFDAHGLTVTRHEARSVDGALIPYVQVGPQQETGKAPVHLSAYGGFGISTLPHYQAILGRTWLAHGGTTVSASIRGGGEFGPAWHEAGRREGKALSHEDFAAVAADLVARGVTRPGRIAAEGGSNGGLLIANMLTRHPDRFGALFCTIPLIDMRRYSRLLAGASWIAEYGDPELPADWAFLQTISAYHTVVPGRRYPPILLATQRRDDRVHPGHARKMARKLQALGCDAHLYEAPTGGHGYGSNSADVARFAALGAAFLRHCIGWEPTPAAGGPLRGSAGR